jgi:O-antigen/teichoic acid export membrane protein
MRTSLKLNVAANYAGQFYVAVINILLLPIQVGLLGSEAYGLVGFFAVLAGWLQLLDVGLSTTLARETASYRAGGLSQEIFRQLLRVVELLFSCVGVLVALLVFVLSGVIARHWLHPETLTTSTVARAVALMGAVFAFRWQANLSRSILIGLERQVLVNVVTIISATLRSVGVLAVLRWVSPTPGAFFLYQALVAAFELAILRVCVARSLKFGPRLREPWSLTPLRRVAAFSLSVALAGAVYAMVTQLDKLLLSSFLSLADYGWFSLAVTAASGINILSGPIGQAVQPRLTYFFAETNDSALRSTYSDATQVLSAIALTASFVLAGAARPLLWAWTGNNALAERVAPVLALYALGNGQLALVAMTYYLQVASGDLRLHLRGTFGFAVVLAPLIAWATIRKGMEGAAVAWCLTNTAYLLVWTALVHRKFLPGYHLRWLALDTLLPGLAGLLPTLILTAIPWSALSRSGTAAALTAVGALSIGVALLATRPVRRLLRTSRVALS